MNRSLVARRALAGRVCLGLQGGFMYRCSALLVCCLFALATMAQSPAQQPAQQPAQAAASPGAAAPAPTIAVELEKSLDSKKLKSGDEVAARTVSPLRDGRGDLIPAGSKVLGHVTEAKARSKGDAESALGIQFDRITVKKGEDIPLKAAIQAVAPPAVIPAAMGTENGNTSMGPIAQSGQGTSGSRPPMGGTVGMPGSQPVGNPGGYGAPNTPPPSRDTQMGPALGPQSTGVVGISKLQLGPDSVLTSSDKNLKLASGTQMILRVQSQ